MKSLVSICCPELSNLPAPSVTMIKRLAMEEMRRSSKLKSVLPVIVTASGFLAGFIIAGFIPVDEPIHSGNAMSKRIVYSYTFTMGFGFVALFIAHVLYLRSLRPYVRRLLELDVVKPNGIPTQRNA